MVREGLVVGAVLVFAVACGREDAPTDASADTALDVGELDVVDDTGLGTDSGATDSGATDSGATDSGATDDVGSPEVSAEAELLALAVRFYGAQRCGDTHNFMIADHPLGGRCHMQDGVAAGEVDLTGGWHDAGDYIKQTVTIAWSAYAMAKAFEVFPEGFADTDDPAFSGVANGVPDVIDELLVGTDYLARLQLDDARFVTLVGDITDHYTFVTSPMQSTFEVDNGGGARVVDTSGQGDVAGLVAAALAAAARVVAPYDAARGSLYAERAVSAYGFARAHETTTAGEFYEDSTWQDNVFCAEAELFATTGEEDYLTQARTRIAELGPHAWATAWFNPTDLGRHTLAARGETALLPDWVSDGEDYLERVSDAAHVEGICHFWDWGVLAPATGSAFGAALLWDITGEERFATFADGQLHYVMGDNPYARSFVTGFGVNPPTHPHHANAYGRDTLDWDFSFPFAHVLPGALVGGPTSRAFDVTEAGYVDDVNDYIGNEVAIDYNAGLVGLAAFGAARAR